MVESKLSRLASSPIRPFAIRILQKLNPGDIHIWHPYYPRKVRLHSYHHKGYWFYRSEREQETSELYMRLIQPTHTVVEVGAHIGFQTLHFASLTPQGKVIAFEPGSNNLPYCLHNVAGVANVEVRRKAVGAVAGEATFYEDNLSGQNNSLTTVGVELAAVNAASSNFNALEITTTTVEVVTLNEAMADQDVNFIKIDVEGGEVDVLAGATEILDRCRPTLMVEVAPSSRDFVWKTLVEDRGYVAVFPDGRRVDQASAMIRNIFFLDEELATT